VAANNFNMTVKRAMRQWCAFQGVPCPKSLNAKMKRASKGQTVYLYFKDQNIAFAFRTMFM
jgi:hypothetical protein